MIVTLGIATLILTSTVAITMRQGLSLDRELRFIQARQYATAALARTRLALRTKSSYTGEAWTVPPSAAGQPSPALVTTKVVTGPNHPDDRTLEIDVAFSAPGTPSNYHSIQTLSLKSLP